MRKISCFFSVVIMLICLLFCINSYAYAAEEYYENGYKYSVTSDGEATIVKADTTLSGVVTTPETLGGYPVTGIASYGFKGCKGITGLVISQGVTEVRVNCLNGCDNIESVFIPESLEHLDQQAFAYCKGLKRFVVDEENVFFSTDEHGALFNKRKTRLVQYPIGNAGESYVVPDSVIEIDNAAFASCKNITAVTLGENVRRIGTHCFSYCENLESANIPDLVTTIESHTFYECTALQQVTIGSGVTTIGDYTFQGCDSLVNITIPEDVAVIGNGVFKKCSSLEKIELGSNVESIGREAFYSCEGLEYILVDKDNQYYLSDDYGVLFNKDKTELIQYPLGNERASYDIPDGVGKVCMGAFASCADIVAVTVSDSVTVLDEFVFSGCENLNSITMGSGLSVIGQYAFQQCRSLEEIVIGRAVESIGYHAFSNCLSMKSFTVDESNEYFSDDEYGVLFNKEKTRLIQYPVGNSRTYYAIPDTVEVIEDHAFYFCRSITEVKIGKRVTDIGKYSFGFCYALARITMFDSVKNIDKAAFANSSLIKTVTYYGTQEQWQEINISGNNEKLESAQIVFVGADAGMAHGNAYEYSDGVLFISGENPIESLDDGSLYEWSRYSQVTDAIIINGISYIGENAFSGFDYLTVVVADADDMIFEVRSFYGCKSLKSIVSFGNISLKKDAFIEGSESINLLSEKDSEASSDSQNVAVSKFYQNEDTIFFDDKIQMNSYDLFNVIAALCIEYSNVNRLHFSDFTIEDIQFLEWKNENEAIWVNNLTDVTFTVKVLLDNTEQMVSYNELCSLVSEDVVKSFYLVAESDESYRIDDTEVYTQPQDFMLRFLKSIVTLLNKLFKIFGKKK